MFSLRLLINLSSFRANSLWSKATLNRFGIPDLCSAGPLLTPSIKLCWGGASLSLLLLARTSVTLPSSPVAPFMLHWTFLFAISYRSALVFQWPEPCSLRTLPTNSPACASFGRGKRDLPKASQHLRGSVKSAQGYWCKSQMSSGGWKCLPEPLQLRCSWVWSISLRGGWKCLWQVAAADKGVNIFQISFFTFLVCFTLQFFSLLLREECGLSLQWVRTRPDSF